MKKNEIKLIGRSQGLQRSERGFAMVIALIIMTVMFVVVASLSASRQMWGFFSTKQLDKANIEFATKADSENWFRLNRETLLRDPWTLSNSIFMAATATGDGPLAGNQASLVMYMQQGGDEPFRAVITNSSGVNDYPTYGTNSFSLDVPPIFARGTNILFTDRVGAFDPYWGVAGYGGQYSVMFKREMPESVRELREGRFDTNTTQMRAWMSIDAALIARVRYKVLPMSGFTYYFVSSTGTAPITVPITTNFITPLADAYSFRGYSVSGVGMGRIYVDGVVNFATSGATNQPTLGFPIVGTKGYTNLGTTTMNFPSVYGGGSVTTNLTYSNFYPHRYIRYKGMILNSSDTPQRLISRFYNESTNTNTYGFYSKTFTNGILSMYQSLLTASAYLSLDVSSTTNKIRLDTYDPLKFGGNNTNQENFLLSTNNMWAINHTTKEVTLSPSANYFTNFGLLPPSSIYFKFNGTGATNYKLRVNVPSVANLGTTVEQQKLSVISPATVVVSSNGFNSNNSGSGAMIVSPRIVVDSTNAVNIGAYVVTQGVQDNILKPLFAFNPATTPANLTHTITGGLSFTMIAGTGTNDSRPVKIIPSLEYLKGNHMPPSVPALFNIRIAEKELDVYDMTAVP